MPNNGGKITIKDIADDAALRFGYVMADSANAAIEANNKLIRSFKELNSVAGNFRNADGMNKIAQNRIAEAAAIAQVIAAMKEEQLAVTGLKNQIEELNKQISDQAKQIERLNTVRAAGNQRTQEEITNTRLLARNASLAAQANSTYANAYQRLTAQMTISGQKVQDLIVRGRTAEQTQRQYNRELRIAQEEFNRLNARVLLADRAIGRFNRNVGNYPGQAAKGLKELIGAFGVLTGVQAFASIIKDIFNTTRELQSLDLALKNVTGTQQAFAETQEFLSRISEAYGIEINGLTKAYTGFLAAAKNSIEAGKITAGQIQDIFESVSKASGAMGLSVEQQQGAFLALQQMISKGNVQAEEIRGQLAERLPGAFGILAKSMGVTEEQLNKLLKDGKVLAAEVLPAFAKELERAYGVENLERVESLAAATTRLGNAWTDFIREITEGDSVITKFFIKTIAFLDKALKGITDFAKSTNELRDDQLKTVEQNGYAAQLKLLEDMRTSEIELGTAVKERLSLYAANETIKSSQIQLKALRDERNAIDELLPRLEEQAKKERNLLDRRAIKAQYDEANERYNKSLDDTNLILGQQRAAVEFLNRENAKDAKFNAGPEKAKRQKADIDYLKEVYELRKQNIENEIALLSRISDEESNEYDIRLEATQNYYFQKEKLAELDYEEQIRLNNLSLENQTKEYTKAIEDGKASTSNLEEIKNQHTIRKLKIDADYEGKRAQIIAESEKKLDELFISNFEKQLKRRQQEFDNSLNVDLIRENERFSNEQTSLREREGAIERHEKNILEIKRLYAIRALEEQIKSLESLLDVEDITADKRKEIEARVYEARKNLSDLITNNEKENSQKIVETYKKQLEEIKQMSLDLKDALIEFANTLFDARIANIDNDIANTEAYYQKQIELAGEDKRKKELLEKESEKKTSDLEKKKREEQRKQAIFNKAVSIAEIGMNTAQGIMKAYAQTGPIAGSVFAAIISALGAVQLATVIATPIPKYKHGRKGGKKELAYVGDGNVSEVIESKDGKAVLTPNRATLTMLEEGDKVHKNTDEYFKSKLARKMNYEIGKINTLQTLMNRDKHDPDEIKEAIKDAIKQGFRDTKIINNNEPPVIDLDHFIWAANNKKW